MQRHGNGTQMARTTSSRQPYVSKLLGSIRVGIPLLFLGLLCCSLHATAAPATRQASGTTQQGTAQQRPAAAAAPAEVLQGVRTPVDSGSLVGVPSLPPDWMQWFLSMAPKTPPRPAAATAPASSPAAAPAAARRQAAAPVTAPSPAATPAAARRQAAVPRASPALAAKPRARRAGVAVPPGQPKPALAPAHVPTAKAPAPARTVTAAPPAAKAVSPAAASSSSNTNRAVPAATSSSNTNRAAVSPATGSSSTNKAAAPPPPHSRRQPPPRRLQPPAPPPPLPPKQVGVPTQVDAVTTVARPWWMVWTTPAPKAGGSSTSLSTKGVGSSSPRGSGTTTPSQGAGSSSSSTLVPIAGSGDGSAAAPKGSTGNRSSPPPRGIGGGGSPPAPKGGNGSVPPPKSSSGSGSSSPPKGGSGSVPPPKSSSGSGSAPPPKSSSGSGSVPPPKSSGGSGSVPPPKSSSGSGSVPPPKSSSGSGSAPPPKSSSGSGSVPPPKSSSGSGSAPTPKSSSGSGSVPPPKSSSGSGSVPPPKSSSGSGSAPTPKGNGGKISSPPPKAGGGTISSPPPKGSVGTISSPPPKSSTGSGRSPPAKGSGGSGTNPGPPLVVLKPPTPAPLPSPPLRPPPRPPAVPPVPAATARPPILDRQDGLPPGLPPVTSRPPVDPPPPNSPPPIPPPPNPPPPNPPPPNSPPPNPPPPNPPPPSPPPPRPPPPPPPPPPNRPYCAAGGTVCCLPAGNVSCPVCTGEVTGAYTGLWACKGELAAASLAGGNLYDWSYAGYAAGDQPIPALTVRGDMKADFGAVGDGVADDSAPFVRALQFVRDRAVLYIPPGTYKITRQLIVPSRIVFRGAGPGRTILHFPLPLSRWLNPIERDDGTTIFTRGNAWIQFEGVDAWNSPGNFLASVTRAVTAGDTQLSVSNSSAFAVGQWVLLSLDDRDSSLTRAMAGWDWGDSAVTVQEGLVRWATPVTAVSPGTITIQRVLPLDIPLSWRPRLWTTAGYRRTLCGLESLSITFPWTPYRGPGTEAGWNAVVFANVQHSWVRDVEVVNADMPLVLTGVSHFSVVGLKVNVTRARNPELGLHGSRALWLKGSCFDVLVSNFTQGSRYAQDVALSGAVVGTVLTWARGVDLGVMLEGRLPYATLMTQVNFGLGTRPFMGPRSAASGLLTVWNCWASDTNDGSLPPPPPLYAVQANFIGTRFSAGLAPAAAARWRVEGSTMGAWRDVLAAPVVPENLWARQQALAPYRGWSPAANLAVTSPTRLESGGGMGQVGYGCTTAGAICCFAAGGRAPGPDCPLCPSSSYRLPSALFGCAGELWRPSGRLPDFSYAGYMAGEAPIPQNQPIVANLKTDFGAAGDGVTDDTDAFLAALGMLETAPPATSKGVSAGVSARLAELSKASDQGAADISIMGVEVGGDEGAFSVQGMQEDWLHSNQVLMSGDWPVALLNEVAGSSPTAGGDSSKGQLSSSKTSKVPAADAGGLLSYLQQTATASAATAAAAAAAQHPNQTLVPRYGTKQNAVYATWALDPTYTLLLDPRALPAVQGQLGATPLPQMFAGTHLGNTVDEGPGANTGLGPTASLPSSSRNSSSLGSRSLLGASSGATLQEPWGEAVGAAANDPTAAGAWAAASPLQAGPTWLGSRPLLDMSQPQGLAAAAGWQLPAYLGQQQQQQQQGQGQQQEGQLPDASPVDSSRASSGHRQLLQSNDVQTKGVQNGVLYLPPGTYVLKKRLDMRRPNLVIRGAGVESTTIYIPVSLSDVYGNTLFNGSSDQSQWSHSVGFINFFGWDPMVPWNRLAVVTRPARIGDTRLYVNNATALRSKVGQWVRFTMDGNITSLMADMAAGYMQPGPGQLSSNAMGRVYRLLTRVVAVGPDWVQMERPLTANVSLDWAPRFHEHAPQVSSNGIENLTIRFKWSPYKGHLKEDGYNAIHFNQLVNSWVRNVRIINADAGVYTWGAQHCTITNLELGVTQSRATPECNCGNQHGHRGVWMERGSDNLVTRFNMTMPMVHDITLSWTEMHSVVVNGTGQDVNIDHHRNLPYANLITAIDHGRGARPYESSGAEPYGSHAGPYTTFWANYGQLGFYYPAVFDGPQTPGYYGPMINFVGQKSFDAAPAGWAWWAEELWPLAWPPNLYTAMLATRARRLNLTAAVAS